RGEAEEARRAPPALERRHEQPQHHPLQQQRQEARLEEQASDERPHVTLAPDCLGGRDDPPRHLLLARVVEEKPHQGDTDFEAEEDRGASGDAELFAIELEALPSHVLDLSTWDRRSPDLLRRLHDAFTRPSHLTLYCHRAM